MPLLQRARLYTELALIPSWAPKVRSGAIAAVSQLLALAACAVRQAIFLTDAHHAGTGKPISS